MSTLFDIWNSIESNLFPYFDEVFDPLSENEQQFVRGIALLDLGKHLKPMPGAELAVNGKAG